MILWRNMDLFFKINENEVIKKIEKMLKQNIKMKDEFLKWVMLFEINENKVND